MWTTFLPLFLINVLVHGVKSQTECQAYNIESCVEEVRKLYGTEGAVLSHDDTVLTSLCRHTQDAMRCIDQYVQRCLDDSHQSIYRDVTAGLVTFVREFCDEGSQFSKAYRQHLPCYNNLSDSFRDCSNYMSLAKEEVETKHLRSGDAIRLLCCNFDRMTSCFRSAVVLRNCSMQAADFVAVIFEKLFGNFTRKLNCENYSYDDPNCSSSTNSLLDPSLAVLGLCLSCHFWHYYKLSRLIKKI